MKKVASTQNKSLYDVNKEVTALVKENMHLLSEQKRQDAMCLLFHLDVWSAIWVDEYSKQKPKLTDTFVFENSVTFPKNSVERLLCLNQ